MKHLSHHEDSPDRGSVSEIVGPKANALELDAARLFAMARMSDAMRELPGAGPAARILYAAAARKLEERAVIGPDGAYFDALAALVRDGQWPPRRSVGL